MNRGIFGLSPAEGRGTGMKIWTAGYQYVDETPASSEARSSDMKAFAVRILPKRSCLMTNVDVFYKGNASNVNKLEAVLADDATVDGNSFSKPGKIIAVSAYGGSNSGVNPMVVTALLDTTPRWISIPFACWLQGGVPVWIVFKAGYFGTLYYDDYGTAPQADFYEQNAADTQSYHVSELNITWVQSTKRWMIRAVGIQ